MCGSVCLSLCEHMWASVCYVCSWRGLCACVYIYMYTCIFSVCILWYMCVLSVPCTYVLCVFCVYLCVLCGLVNMLGVHMCILAVLCIMWMNATSQLTSPFFGAPRAVRIAYTFWCHKFQDFFPILQNWNHFTAGIAAHPDPASLLLGSWWFYLPRHREP